MVRIAQLVANDPDLDMVVRNGPTVGAFNVE